MPTAERPPDVTIRRQRPGDPDDAAAVREVTQRAFGDEGLHVAGLVVALGASSANVGLSFVAATGGQVVGHVMLTRSWVDAPRALVEVLVLSPLSVDPGHQGCGIGSALVRRALREAEHAGAVAVFLEGDPGYYSGLGFRPGAGLGFTRPSVRIPESAFQVVVLPARHEWMTGALVYADPFWAGDCVGLR